MKKKYLIVVEKAKKGFSSYSPDLPGCIAAGKTRKAVEKKMQEAIEFHLEGLRLEGQKVPKPHSYSTYLEIAA